jgi:hypothetical protein
MVILASIGEGPIQVTDVVERQKLKQLEDILLDILVVLDSTLDTVSTLLEQYQTTFFRSDVGRTSNSPTTEDDIVVTLLEKRRDILLFRTKVDAIRSKVQGTIAMASHWHLSILYIVLT